MIVQGFVNRTFLALTLVWAWDFTSPKELIT